MKKNTFLMTMLVVLFASNLVAQKEKQTQAPTLPVDSATKFITYRGVVVQQGTQTQLFQRAMDWIGLYYKNTAEVVKTSDVNTGTIEGSSRIKIHTPAKDGTFSLAGIVNYNFTIEVKEGRYRYTFTRFVLKDAAYNPIEKWFDTKLPTWYPQRFEHLKEVDAEMAKTITALKESMKPKAEKNDSW